ncbi:MAG: hypothetical protein ACRDFB_00920, partial [Rhabdochlamydiaceae bacterium]
SRNLINKIEKAESESIIGMKTNKNIDLENLLNLNKSGESEIEWAGSNILKIQANMPIEFKTSLNKKEKNILGNTINIFRNEIPVTEILLSVDKTEKAFEDWTGSKVITLVNQSPIEIISTFIKKQNLGSDNVTKINISKNMTFESLLTNIIREKLVFSGISKFQILNPASYVEYQAELEFQEILGIDTVLEHALSLYKGMPIEGLNQVDLKDSFGSEWTGFNIFPISSDMKDSPLVVSPSLLWTPSINRMLVWNNYNNFKSEWPAKQPGDYANYSWRFLDHTDPVISGQISSITPSGLVINVVNTWYGRYLTFWVSGGTDWNIYGITFKITRQSGRIEYGTSWLQVYPLSSEPPIQ